MRPRVSRGEPGSGGSARMGYGRCRGASFPPDPKLGRRRRPEATPVPNITWPEPAARSLTLAATIGGVSKKKVHWFWRPAAGGPEPEAKTGRPAIGVAWRSYAQGRGTGTCRRTSPPKPASSRALPTVTFRFITPQCRKCRHACAATPRASSSAHAPGSPSPAGAG